MVGSFNLYWFLLHGHWQCYIHLAKKIFRQFLWGCTLDTSSRVWSIRQHQVSRNGDDVESQQLAMENGCETSTQQSTNGSFSMDNMDMLDSQRVAGKRTFRTLGNRHVSWVREGERQIKNRIRSRFSQHRSADHELWTTLYRLWVLHQLPSPSWDDGLRWSTWKTRVQRAFGRHFERKRWVQR